MHSHYGRGGERRKSQVQDARNSHGTQEILNDWNQVQVTWKGRCNEEYRNNWATKKEKDRTKEPEKSGESEGRRVCFK